MNLDRFAMTFRQLSACCRHGHGIFPAIEDEHDTAYVVIKAYDNRIFYFGNAMIVCTCSQPLEDAHSKGGRAK